MPPPVSAKFYAVAVGHRRGVFRDWPTVLKSITGFPRAVQRAFKTESEALSFLSQYGVTHAGAPGSTGPQPLESGVGPPSYGSAPAGTTYSALRGSKYTDPTQCFLMQFDGGSRGNPGAGGCGVVIFTPQQHAPGSGFPASGSAPPHREPIYEAYKFDHGPVTNNAMEYEGLLMGLAAAARMGVRRLVLEGDSQLVVRQLEGSYAVHAEHLRERHAAARAFMNTTSCFEYVGIRHVYREANARADGLANLAMDEGSGLQRYRAEVVAAWRLSRPFAEGEDLVPAVASGGGGSGGQPRALEPPRASPPPPPAPDKLLLQQRPPTGSDDTTVASLSQPVNATAAGSADIAAATTVVAASALAGTKRPRSDSNSPVADGTPAQQLEIGGGGQPDVDATIISSVAPQRDVRPRLGEEQPVDVDVEVQPRLDARATATSTDPPEPQEVVAVASSWGAQAVTVEAMGL